MAEYYLICENVFSNSSALSVDDRNHYFEDTDAPLVSVSNNIRAFEEIHPSHTRDLHTVGEIFCIDAIAQIITKHNPYRCHFFPCTIEGKSGYHLLSLNHILASADMEKSDIFVFPKRKNHIKVLELYLDLETLRQLPIHQRQIFIVKEAHDRIVVSKRLGEALLEYVALTPGSTLMIKPISSDGRVPEPY